MGRLHVKTAVMTSCRQYGRHVKNATWKWQYTYWDYNEKQLQVIIYFHAGLQEMVREMLIFIWKQAAFSVWLLVSLNTGVLCWLVKEVGYTLQALEICGNEISISILRINTLGLNAMTDSIYSFFVASYSYCVSFGGILLNCVDQLHDMQRQIFILLAIS